MRKYLFNFIIIAKGAHYFVYTFVRITDDDVIRKDGGRQEDVRWVDVNKGGAHVGSRNGVVRVDGQWSGQLCCSLSVVRRFSRCLIQCKLLSLFGRIVRYFGCSQHKEILIISSIK